LSNFLSFLNKTGRFLPMDSFEDDNRSISLKVGYRQRTTATRQSPRLLAGLLSILVVLLHLWLVLRLMNPPQPPVKPKSVMIEVSLLPAPMKRVQTPIAASPAPAPVIKKPQVNKPKPTRSKPVVKSPPREKVAERKVKPQPKPPVEPVIAEPKPPAETASTPVVETAKSVAPAPTLASAVKPATGASTSAKEIPRATCVRCPNPNYPAIARRRGWQGSVLLTFQLSPEGMARDIVVARSSGHEMLDEAAMANAKESRFTASEPGVIRTATKLFNFKLN
jgi:periplasmic protein TonB